jgi:hypothetical protein
MAFIDPEKVLHVVSGSSAAGCLKQALRVRNHQVLVGDNELHCGPAPMMADLLAWYRMRKNYSDDLFSNYLAYAFDAPEPMTVSIGDEPETGPHIDGERLSEASEVHLWVTQSLHDQLLIALIVLLFDRFQFDHSKLRVVEFPETHQKWPIRTVGELNPETINRLNHGPRSLDPEQIEELRKVWRAYTSNDPGLLIEYLAGSSSLPFLQRAMAELVQRYPDVQTGLNRWDNALLQQTIENGPLLLRVFGYTWVFDDTPDIVGESYLFDRITKLGGTNVSSPLVSLSTSDLPRKRPIVEITDFGKRVLAGEANHVEENGIDDWIGGVHLTPDTVVFRDRDRLLLS